MDLFECKFLSTLETLEKEGKIKRETCEDGDDKWFLHNSDAIKGGENNVR